ncbi:MAG: hypothetical protein RQM95_04755 [Syntrophaceticus schinkii]
MGNTEWSEQDSFMPTALKKLEEKGSITLPAKQEDKIHDNRDRIEFGVHTRPAQLIEGSVSDFEPIGLELVRSRDGIRLWNEYVHRYQP